MPLAALGQEALLAVDGATRVRSIDFTFTDSDRYAPHEGRDGLKNRIAATAPSRLRRMLLGFGIGDSSKYLLYPVELQRDVVRLRNYFYSEGYLQAWVDYADSDFDSTANAISVRFSIRQGPPIIIQDVGFFAEGGYLATTLPREVRTRWVEFRDATGFSTGDRYTAFDVVRIEDQVVSWLKNEGYAFTTLHTVVDIDSVYATADIEFVVDAGPRAVIDSVLIAGNRRVGERVVRRELPFEEGDMYTARALVRGQRELFGLNLFQVAQTAVPDQPRDSTVTIQVQLREARLRYLTAETGYNQERGLVGEGQWSHRNFFGGARTFTAVGEIESGILASTGLGAETSRLYRASVGIVQPYFIAPRLSGIVEPFLLYERDPLLRDTRLPFSINRREQGVNTTFIYELQPFRVISLRYGLTRTTQFAPTRGVRGRDDYGTNVVTLSGSLGWTDDPINPHSGLIIRPFVERAGAFERAASIAYVKAGLELSGYIPLSGDVHVGIRVGAGRLWPLGQARLSRSEPGALDPIFISPLEDRFDQLLFYSGGADDVRGWSNGLLGPKVNRTEFVRDAEGEVVMENSLPRTQSEAFEPVGGKSRLRANLEVRLPMPGLSSAWRAAAFLDGGRVSSEYDLDVDCTRVPSPGELTVPIQCGVQDSGSFGLRRFKFAIGGGIRYRTPVGFVRVDVAMKLNPDDLDLQTPRDAFLSVRGLAEPDRRLLRRFNVHVSLGQAF